MELTANLNRLIDHVENCRVSVRDSVFFSDLCAGQLDGLHWLWQLLHWSGWFTRALSARSGACENERFTDVFAEHAVEEARHPAQLKRFLRSEGRDVDGASWPKATLQTCALRDVIRHVALGSDPLLQVLALNLLSEGIALDFYVAILDHFGAGVLRGPYFHVHRDVDDRHRLLGLSLLSPPSDADVTRCLGELSAIRDGYRAMIDSWARFEHEFRA